MRTRRVTFPSLLIVCALLGGCAGNTTSDEDKAAPSSSDVETDTTGGPGKSPRDPKDALPSPADPAPEFEVLTFDGETFALGEQRGTPVVLNFWESW